VCPAFERFPKAEAKEALAALEDQGTQGTMGTSSFPPARFPKKKGRPPPNYKIKLGNSELDRLWSLSENNLQVCVCISRISYDSAPPF